jgi:NTP pyrophosphatase (non-canonical NTP hydrolase)
MKLDEYQSIAMNTAVMADVETNVSHFGFGLCAEAGEVASVFQKYFRGDPRYYTAEGWDILEDDLSTFTPEAKDMVKKELGDVLWFLSAIASTFGIRLEDVAVTNLRKLAKRADEGKIKGDGDNR